MKTIPLTYENALDVARNMRDADKREIYATRWTESPEDLASDCLRLPDFAWTFHLGEKPVCAMGAFPSHPGCWSVWMFATNEFRKISIYVTKFALRVMMPALMQAGARRAHCLSIEGHHDAHRWLLLLGAKPESRLHEFGRNGEDFHFFVWRASDVRTRSVRRRRP